MLEAFRRPAIDFADPEFVALADGIWADMPDIFGGADEIVVLTTVGHGAWESALTNTLDPGDAVLIPDCGLFGRRWAMMARDPRLRGRVHVPAHAAAPPTRTRSPTSWRPTPPTGSATSASSTPRPPPAP